MAGNPLLAELRPKDVSELEAMLGDVAPSRGPSASVLKFFDKKNDCQARCERNIRSCANEETAMLGEELGTDLLDVVVVVG